MRENMPVATIVSEVLNNQGYLVEGNIMSAFEKPESDIMKVRYRYIDRFYFYFEISFLCINAKRVYVSLSIYLCLFVCL